MEEPVIEKIEESPPVEVSTEVVIEARPTKTERPAAIVVDAKTQQLVAKDQSELVRMIKVFMAGKAIPKTLDTEAKVIAAWQMAASLKVPPALAMQNMAFVNGSISIWGQLPKALAEATGELEDCTVICINRDQKEISLANQNLQDEVWGAVVRIKRKGRSMNEYFFTEDDAKKAGLLGKSGPWQDYRKIMYTRRALGMGIKIEFPDAIMGLNIAEEFNEAPDLKDVTPRGPSLASRADELNQRFTSKEENTPEATVQ